MIPNRPTETNAPAKPIPPSAGTLALADQFYRDVRDGCTPDQIAALCAERGYSDSLTQTCRLAAQEIAERDAFAARFGYNPSDPFHIDPCYSDL